MSFDALGNRLGVSVLEQSQGGLFCSAALRLRLQPAEALGLFSPAVA